MKAVLVNKFYYLQGGSDKYVFELTRLLEEKGIEVIPFSMKDERNSDSSYSSYFVSNINLQGKLGIKDKALLPFRVVYSAEAKRKFSKLLDDVKPDIVHLHNIAHHISPSVIPVAKKKDISVIQTFHDFKILCPSYLFIKKGESCELCANGNFLHSVINRCVKNSYSGSALLAFEMFIHRFSGIYNGVDRFVCPSRFMLEKIKSYGVIDDNKLVYIPNFVNVKNYKVSPEYDNYYLYFGRLSEEKGVDVLLNAVDPSWKEKLVIVGDGIERETLEKIKRKRGLNNVEFVGYKRGDELKKILSRAMFTVIPSRCYENSPLALFESFASGKPVIGSRIGGIPELINEGSDGLLFESQNPESLREKIGYFISNKDKLIEFGREGRKKIESDFNEKKHIGRIVGLYEKIRAEKTSGRQMP